MKAAGATPSNYIGNQLLISRDTTSLNFSNVPTTTIEVGNMRNAQEARRMSSSAGQRQYADWLFAGIERFFARSVAELADAGRAAGSASSAWLSSGSVAQQVVLAGDEVEQGVVDGLATGVGEDDPHAAAVDGSGSRRTRPRALEPVDAVGHRPAGDEGLGAELPGDSE